MDAALTLAGSARALATQYGQWPPLFGARGWAHCSPWC